MSAGSWTTYHFLDMMVSFLALPFVHTVLFGRMPSLPTFSCQVKSSLLKVISSLKPLISPRKLPQQNVIISLSNVWYLPLPVLLHLSLSYKRWLCGDSLHSISETQGISKFIVSAQNGASESWLCSQMDMGLFPDPST